MVTPDPYKLLSTFLHDGTLTKAALRQFRDMFREIPPFADMVREDQGHLSLALQQGDQHRYYSPRALELVITYDLATNEQVAEFAAALGMIAKNTWRTRRSNLQIPATTYGIARLVKNAQFEAPRGVIIESVQREDVRVCSAMELAARVGFGYDVPEPDQGPFVREVGQIIREGRDAARLVLRRSYVAAQQRGEKKYLDFLKETYLHLFTDS